MALSDWTNNFNDLQATATIQFRLSGAASEDDVAINVDEYVALDSDGGANWAVGDEFTIQSDLTETIHSIISIDVNSGVATQAIIGVTPALAQDSNNNKLVTKEGGPYASDGSTGYKGNQRSMENHIRLRNQGQI